MYDLSAGINRLESLCKQKELDIALLHFSFNGLDVRGVYFVVTKNVLFGLKARNIGWFTNCTEKLLISEKIPKDVYPEIVAFLPDGKPRSFFEALEVRLLKITLSEITRPDYTDIRTLVGTVRTGDRKYDPEGDKPYFKTWRRNVVRRVEWPNLEKTARYFGEDIKRLCQKENISSVWSASPTSKWDAFMDQEQVIRDINERAARQ